MQDDDAPLRHPPAAPAASHRRPSRCYVSWNKSCDHIGRKASITVSFEVDDTDAGGSAPDTYESTLTFHWGSIDTIVGPDTYNVNEEYEESDSHQFDDGEYVVGYEVMVLDVDGSLCNTPSFEQYTTVIFEGKSCWFGDIADKPTPPATTTTSTATTTTTTSTEEVEITPPPTISSTVNTATPTPKPSTPPPTISSTKEATNPPVAPPAVETATPTPKPGTPPATNVPTPKPTAPTQEVACKMVLYHSEPMDPDAVEVWKGVTEKTIRSEAVLFLDQVERPSAVKVAVELEDQSILSSRARALRADDSAAMHLLRGLQSSSPLEIEYTTAIQIESNEDDWSAEEIVASAFQTPAKRSLYIYDLKNDHPEFGRVEKMTLAVNGKFVPEIGEGDSSGSTDGSSEGSSSNTVYYIVAAVAGVLGIGLAVGIYASKRSRAEQGSQASSTKAKPDKDSMEIETREGFVDIDTPDFDSGGERKSDREQVGPCLGYVEAPTLGMDDISTLGDPYIGDGGVPLDGDNTVGPSVMSSQQKLYVYGVRKSDAGTRGDSTVISGFTKPVFTDDYLEDSYKPEIGLQQFTVFAPPGKLGLVLDNPHGDVPFVFAVKDESVLKGKVCVGDSLLCVDEMDCRGMSAHDLSMLLNSRAENERKLVLARAGTAQPSQFDLENV